MELQGEDRTISSEDLVEWTQHPITQAYFREVNSKIKETVLYLGEGHSVNKESADFTAQETSRLVGKIEAFREVLDIELVKD